MFSTIQSFFQRSNKPEEYSGLKMKWQVYSTDYGIGKVISVCDTKSDAISTIQRLVPGGQSYTIREVFVSAE